MDAFTVMACLECGKELRGRKDKKFCDNECKSAFHNRNKTISEEMIHSFNRILRHNRRILYTLCPEGKATVRMEVLRDLGYDFRFFTNLYQSPKGGTYYLCYDYGFTPFMEGDKEKVVIIKRQDYMNRYSPI